MKMFNAQIKKVLFWLPVVTSISFNSIATAANCKGLETAACGEQTSCYWVEGYQRKDGANVKAHCRAKPNKSIADKVSTNEPPKVEVATPEDSNKQEATAKQ